MLNELQLPAADIDDINDRLEFLVLTIKVTSKSSSILEDHYRKKRKSKRKCK